MEDDKIKSLFNDFAPELSSDPLFMARLERNMESVELVRRHTASVGRRNRIAVGVAALVGFGMGVLLTLLLPCIGDAITSLAVAIPHHGLLCINIDWKVVGWIVAGAVCVLSALNAYEITVAGLSARAVRQFTTSPGERRP